MSEQNEQRVFIAVVILLLSLSTNCNPKENYPSGLTFQKIDHNFISIDWSPDSKRLVGTTMPNSGSGINIGFPGSEVYVWEPGSDSYEQVSDEAETRWNSDAVWHPQGEQILYYSKSEFGKEFQLGLVNLATKEIVPLLKYGQFPAWFPDGQSIALTSFDVYVVDSTTKASQKIWSPPRGQLIMSLAVSPDGLQLVVSTEEVGEPTNRIFIISADGKSDEIIYEVQGALNRLDWSPDGRWITFKDSTQNRDVVAIRLEDKCLTEPLGLEAITGSSVSISDIKWSPNGELIAVIGVRNRQKGVFYIETASNVVEDWLETATCN